MLLESLFEEVRDREGEKACCSLSFRFPGFFSLLGLGPPEDRASVTIFTFHLPCTFIVFQTQIGEFPHSEFEGDY